MSNLAVGDRLRRDSWPPGPFVVDGFTARGKVILRHEKTGRLVKGWWRSFASLPGRWEWVSDKTATKEGDSE